MTKAEADSPHRKAHRGRGCLISIAIVAGVMVILFSLFALERRYKCVVMPNGFLIGRATVFPYDTGIEPDVAIKYPDGRVFVRGGGRTMKFWDHDSFSGIMVNPSSDRSSRYVYVNDVGLILEDEQPELFRQYFGIKMAAHRARGGAGSTNLYGVYYLLKQDLETPRTWCKTAWF